MWARLAFWSRFDLKTGQLDTGVEGQERSAMVGAK